MVPLLAALVSVALGNPTRVIRHDVPLDGAAGVRRTEVQAGAGSLTVRAVSGLDRIEVTGTAWASNDALLAAVAIDVACLDDGVRIRTVIPETGDRQQAGIDLEVRVPAGWSAEVDDGSGETVLEGLAAVELTDGSGAAAIRDVEGPVAVKDGSGDLRIEQVAGPVAVTDGSGDVAVRQVVGPVAVTDGSGDIEVTRVEGPVRVTDGSGDITVDDVRGDVNLVDGSGDRRVTRVAGRVVTPPPVP